MVAVCPAVVMALDSLGEELRRSVRGRSAAKGPLQERESRERTSLRRHASFPAECKHGHSRVLSTMWRCASDRQRRTGSNPAPRLRSTGNTLVRMDRTRPSGRGVRKSRTRCAAGSRVRFYSESGSVFRVEAYTAGYTYDLVRYTLGRIGIGANATYYRFPDVLQFFYGERPRTVFLFLCARLGAPMPHMHD